MDTAAVTLSYIYNLYGQIRQHFFDRQAIGISRLDSILTLCLGTSLDLNCLMFVNTSGWTPGRTDSTSCTYPYPPEESWRF